MMMMQLKTEKLYICRNGEVIKLERTLVKNYLLGVPGGYYYGRSGLPEDTKVLGKHADHPFDIVAEKE